MLNKQVYRLASILLNSQGFPFHIHFVIVLFLSRKLFYGTQNSTIPNPLIISQLTDAISLVVGLCPVLRDQLDKEPDLWEMETFSTLLINLIAGARHFGRDRANK